jgi:hypothetical protein
MSMVRRLSLTSQHVVVAALRNHLEKYPESTIIPPLLDVLAVGFPNVFVAEIEEDAKLITDGCGDMVDVFVDFPEKMT